jgi:hypothetical protein
MAYNVFCSIFANETTRSCHISVLYYNSVIIHFRAEIFTHLSDLNLIKFHATC